MKSRNILFFEDPLRQMQPFRHGLGNRERETDSAFILFGSTIFASTPNAFMSISPLSRVFMEFPLLSADHHVTPTPPASPR